jgi:hypothetical protein
MSGGFALERPGGSRRLIALWTLSFLGPMLLVAAVQASMAAAMPSPVAYGAVSLVPLLGWAVIGYVQYRPLPGLGRGRLWPILTVAGGALGHLGGGLLRVRMTPWLMAMVYGSEDTPDWLFAAASQLFYVVGVGAHMLILGLLQCFAFDGPARDRLLWFAASAAAGVVAGIGGGAAQYGYIMLAIDMGLPGLLPGRTTLDAGLDLAAAAASAAIYGLLTGTVLAWVLQRRARRQNKSLVERFD